MILKSSNVRPWAATRPLFATTKLTPQSRDRNQAMIRALCANAYLGNETSLCRVLGHYKMFIDTQDVGLSAHLLLDGYWEMWLTEALVSSIRPGMTVVDVGANLGYFSILMADLVGAGGSVYAFEPNGPIAERFRKSIDVNGFGKRITLHQIALGEIDQAAVRLIVPGNEPKNAFVVAADDASDDPTILRSRRLDGFPEVLNADIIKIDAETAEQAIWRGMRGIFARGRSLTIFLEFNIDRYPDAAIFVEEILAEGFSLARLDLEKGIMRVTVEDILKYQFKEDQMLVLRR